MSDLGVIEGLPELQDGITIVVGENIAAAVKLATLAYAAEAVMAKNIVAIDGSRPWHYCVEGTIARAYLKSIGEAIPCPLENDDVEDAWERMVENHAVSRVRRLSENDKAGADLVITIPETEYEAEVLLQKIIDEEDAKMSNAVRSGAHTTVDYPHIICIPKPVLDKFRVPAVTLLALHTANSIIDVYKPNGSCVSHVQVKYCGGVLLNA